ncbi:uncharacterized protein LOC143182538 [Calliopsis andreniformis]|uniref:uncharacterized protein LOC143182538 n=1 Tax=Calliopsis andreniformis TaxID=337506 RepID=UPI003FCC431B
MDGILKRYYKWNYIYLSMLGMWPYSNFRFLRIYIVICSGLLFWCLSAQLLFFVTTDVTLKLLLHNFSIILIMLISIIKYMTMALQRTMIRVCLDHISHDWSLINDRREFEIMEKYSAMRQYYVNIFTFLIWPAMIYWILFPYLSSILDVVIPLNHSRPNQFTSNMEFFVDQKEHFHLLNFLVNSTALLVGTSYMASETLYVSFVSHACSMFDIVRYCTRCNFLILNFKNSFQIEISSLMQKDKTIRLVLSCYVELRVFLIFLLEDSSKYFERMAFSVSHLDLPMPLSNLVIKRTLVSAVHLHKRNIHFHENSYELNELSYSLFALLGVISLSVNLFRFSIISSLRHEFDDFFVSVLFIVIQYVYMFIVNYIFQQLFDRYDAIFFELQNVQWYRFPICNQKFLLFMILQCNRPMKCELFGIYRPSVKGFSKLAKSTLSYFMVFRSIKERNVQVQ